jgi:hypothetical protein
MDERNEFIIYNMNGKGVSSRNASEPSSAYLFYNEANAVEDKILFPEESVSNKSKAPFREIQNGVSRIERGMLPSSARMLGQRVARWDLKHNVAETLSTAEADSENDDDYDDDYDDDDDDDYDDDYDGALWDLPKVWESAMQQVLRKPATGQRRKLLKRTGLDDNPSRLSLKERSELADPMERMERDRSVGEWLDIMHLPFQDIHSLR